MITVKKSKDRVLGALLGVAVGDALGAPLEFMSAEEIRSKHGDEVREMIGGGWLNVAPGEITDDTQMTLAVAEGIAENPCDPIPAIGRRFIEWYDGRPKDIGNCCRGAITYAKADGASDFQGWFSAAQRVHEETGGRTAGNGALMRTIYPALWYGYETIQAEQIARMTHIHNHSRLTVIAYTRAVADLIGADYDIKWGKERIEYHIKTARDLINDKKLQPDGYAPNSLVCAANAIRDTDSFEDALVRAVNLGGDADTIGAITGGLAGALYGAEAIPQRWTDTLDKGIMKRLIFLTDMAYRRVV
jgi:ADP-ribosyl-[dinitrogen reductase] hydrolase